MPYRDPETLKLFLKTIGEFEYTHSEKLGDAFEYLLSVMGSQGDAGQFRTPRHIIDFLVEAVDPEVSDTILDPACGTAGFLISAFKYIKEKNNNELTPDQRKKLIKNFAGYDISPDMVRLSLVNLYLHGFSDPHIVEYDTLTSEDRWDDNFDVVLANPPFMSPKGGIRPHKRFSVASNRSEVLFVDYIAEHLNPKGRAGIIVPEGVIFQSGKAYKALRKMLVENYLYAVVSLPAGVFNPYSGVKTSILLMDKELAKKKERILFVKIDNDGYNLGAQRNAVTGGQLGDAVELLKQFKNGDFGESEIAHAVLKTEIGKNGDYNLSGERYKVQITVNSDYKLKKLEDLCSIMAGGTPKRDKPQFWGGDIPWVGSGVCKNTKVIESKEFITEEGLKNSSAKLLKVKTSLIALVGATIGKTGFLTFECSTNQNVAGLYPLDLSKLNPKYLFLALQNLYPQFLNLSEGKFRMANLSFIRSLEIPLPPLSVQEEIVTEIEGYQKIIDGAKMVVENYKPKIVIDPEWEMVELEEVIEGKPKNGYSGKPVQRETNLKVLTLSATTSGTLNSEKFKYLDEEISQDAECRCRNGDIYLQRGNTKELVGTAALFDIDSSDLIYPDLMIRLRANEKLILTKYLLYVLQSNPVRKFITANAVGSAGSMPKINQGIVVRIPIPLPAVEVQRLIITQIEEEQELVSANKKLIEIFEQKIKDRIAKIWGE